MLTSQVINAIKRTFSRSKDTIAFRNKQVVSGVFGKRGGKMGECSVCESLTPMYLLEVDHIDPVVPLMIPGKLMSFIMLFSRTFCPPSNLQVICKTCHKIKSKKEMAQRVEWRKKKKFLVIRNKQGGRMKVFPMVNAKTFAEDWECMSVFQKRKDAETDLKYRRKL